MYADIFNTNSGGIGRRTSIQNRILFKDLTALTQNWKTGLLEVRALPVWQKEHRQQKPKTLYFHKGDWVRFPNPETEVVGLEYRLCSVIKSATANNKKFRQVRNHNADLINALTAIFMPT